MSSGVALRIRAKLELEGPGCYVGGLNAGNLIRLWRLFLLDTAPIPASDVQKTKQGPSIHQRFSKILRLISIDRMIVLVLKQLDWF